jgi:hypothetical protein
MATLNELHMQERKVEKDTATAEIAVVLNRLTEERRKPDYWERICLVRALSEVFSGCYSLAITHQCASTSSPMMASRSLPKYRLE